MVWLATILYLIMFLPEGAGRHHHSWLHTLDDYASWNMASEAMFLNRSDELSSKFKEVGRTVKVLLLGACDGTGDWLIDRLLNQSHWRGTLVEPEMKNFEDLRTNTARASARLTYHKVAVNDACPTPTMILTFLSVKPDRAHRYPHWFSREIGSVDSNITRGITRFFSTLTNETSFRGTESFTARRQDFDLVNQKVDCVTPDQFLPNSSLASSSSGDKFTTTRYRQEELFNVVKIDTEGRDAAIVVRLLESMHSLRVPLPILVLIENKFASQDVQTALLRVTGSLGYKSTLRYFKNPSRDWISRNDAFFFLPSFHY